MQRLQVAKLSVDEIAQRLRCAPAWVRLSLDAGCPMDETGRVAMRDFMLFQLTNLHRIRRLAGLPDMTPQNPLKGSQPSMRAILRTHLEWLQVRSTRKALQRAAKRVCQRLEALPEL